MNLQERCALCNFRRADHQAWTLNCPTNGRTRIGIVDFDPESAFTPKPEPMPAAADGSTK